MNKIAIVRCEHFNAAHRLHNKNWRDHKNKDVIRKIIFKGDVKSKSLYVDFIKLVADEVDHQLNKTEFSEEKKMLIGKMKAYLGRI